MPPAFEAHVALYFPAGDEAGVCQKIVDMPMEALSGTAMPVEPSAQATWAERAAGVGVPASWEVKCAKPAYREAHIVRQVEEEKVGA